MQRHVLQEKNEDSEIFPLFSLLVYMLISIALWGYVRYYAYVFLSIKEEHTYIFNIASTIVLFAVLKIVIFMENKIRNKKN